MNVFFAFIGSGFSYMEMILIFVVILVAFGPRKLPEVFRTFGNIMTQLRTASREFKSQVMDVEQQIKAEVRDIEKTIEKEAKALENNDDVTEEMDHDAEYSFEDDPYHADMHDEDYNSHPDHADMDDDHATHDVWEDDHSDYDCPEDRARRELDAAAESLVNGNSEAHGTSEANGAKPGAGTADSAKSSVPNLNNSIEGTVPFEIPPGLETPVRRTFPTPSSEQDALADHSAELDSPEADETAEESRDATA